MLNQWKKCSDPSITVSPKVMKMNKVGTHLSLLGKEDTSPYKSIKICLCYALVLPFSSQNPKGRQWAFSCCTSFFNSLAIKVFQNCIIRMFWESHFFWNFVHFFVVIKKKKKNKNLPTLLSSTHVCMLSRFFSCVQLFRTILWSIAHQAPLSMGFSRQEYWSGLPFPPPGDLPDPGIKPCLVHWQADSLPLSHQRSPELNGQRQK